MNFLAHLYLAGDDEALRLGALLGDFVRGRVALETYPEPVREGIRMHRHIDAFIDTLPDFVRLRASLEPPFRRYAGIIIDLGLDHELARRWENYSDQPLAVFDSGVRGMLARNADLVPDGLARFMRYADRHGLFATYAVPDQVTFRVRLMPVAMVSSAPRALHVTVPGVGQVRLDPSRIYFFGHSQGSITGPPAVTTSP